MTTLSSRALITLDYAKEYLKTRASDEGEDDLLIELINAASTEIHNLAGREFKPRGTNPQTRAFDVPASWYGTWPLFRSREFFVGDLAAFPTDVKINGTSINLAAVTALPRVREDWQPFSHLRLDNTILLTPTLTTYRYALVEVTGTWGFPAVPENIKQACRVTVAHWVNRDIATWGEVFNTEEGTLLPLPDTLPRQAYRSVLRFQRPPL
jgi:hypothetical protein